MPAITRSSLIRGPAQCAFDSVTYQASGNIALRIQKRTFDVLVGGAIADKRVDDFIVRATFAPSGKVEGLSSLYAMLALDLGAGLMGASDKAAVFKNAARQVTLEAACITKPPQIRASNRQTVFGEMEIAGLTKDNVEFGTASSRLTHTTGGAPDGVTSSSIKTAPWTISGANLGSDIETENGVIIDFTPQLDEYGTDSNGVVQFFLRDLEVRAQFIPVMGAASFLDALNIDVARGSSMNATGEDLVLSNGFLQVTLNKAEIIEAAVSQTVGENFGRGIVAVATRTSSSGTLATVEVPSS